MKISFVRRFATLAGLAALAAACGSGGLSLSNNVATPTAPTNVKIADGDQHVTVSWTAEPDVNYWIFCATDTNININNWTTLTNPTSRIGAVSPQIVPNLINGLTYSCIVNGRFGSDKGGAASPAVTAITRAGGQNWVVDTPVSVANANGISFGGAVMVQIGDGGGLYYSLDGAAWTKVELGLTANLNGIVYSNGRFIAVGDAGVIVTSTDGANWTQDVSHTTANLRGIAEWGITYVAVGDGGALVTSVDGTNWTVGNSGTTRTLYSVAANNVAAGVIVTGAGGTVLYSPDAGNWQQVAVPTTADLRGSAFGNNTFAVVGAAGTQLVSSDGLNWTLLPSLTANTLNSVTYNANTINEITYSTRFVAVGTGGTAVYSNDGSNWSLTNTASTGEMRSVVFGFSRYKAVGAGGITSVSF